MAIQNYLRGFFAGAALYMTSPAVLAQKAPAPTEMAPAAVEPPAQTYIPSEVLYSAAMTAFNDKNYDLAVDLFSKTIIIAGGNNPTQIILSLNGLGNTYLRMQKFTEAYESFNRAVVTIKLANGNGIPPEWVATIYNNRGKALLLQSAEENDLKKRRDILQNALSDLNIAIHSYNAPSALMYSNRADIYRAIAGVHVDRLHEIRSGNINHSPQYFWGRSGYFAALAKHTINRASDDYERALKTQNVPASSELRQHIREATQEIIVLYRSTAPLPNSRAQLVGPAAKPLSPW